MKKLLTILSITLLFSCNSHKKEKAAATSIVMEFYKHLKSEDLNKAKLVYPKFGNFGLYYKSDSGQIKDVIIIDDSTAFVKTTNHFTNGFGKKFSRDIDFYLTLQKDSTNSKYLIMDTKGLAGYDGEELIQFAKSTGCITSKDTMDSDVIRKLLKADTLQMLLCSQIQGTIRKECKVTNWSWETGWGGSASGKGFVFNGSKYSIPTPQYIISYKVGSTTVTQEEGYLSYDVLYPGQSKDFTFYTSYVGGATRASIELYVEPEKLKKYVLEQTTWDGTEANDLDSLKKWEPMTFSLFLDLPTIGWDFVSSTKDNIEKYSNKMKGKPDIRIGVSSQKVMDENMTFGYNFDKEQLESSIKSLPIFERLANKL
jgi:hypothetical protein